MPFGWRTVFIAALPVVVAACEFMSPKAVPAKAAFGMPLGGLVCPSVLAVSFLHGHGERVVPLWRSVNQNHEGSELILADSKGEDLWCQGSGMRNPR